MKKHDRSPTIAQTAQLRRKERLAVHANLAKAESPSAVQIRTEKIGFAQFLHRQRVHICKIAGACELWMELKNSQTHYSPIRTDNSCWRKLGTTDYRNPKTTSKRALKVVYQVIDETRPTASIFTRYPTAVSMPKHILYWCWGRMQTEVVEPSSTRRALISVRIFFPLSHSLPHGAEPLNR